MFCASPGMDVEVGLSNTCDSPVRQNAPLAIGIAEQTVVTQTKSGSLLCASPCMDVEISIGSTCDSPVRQKNPLAIGIAGRAAAV